MSGCGERMLRLNALAHRPVIDHDYLHWGIFLVNHTRQPLLEVLGLPKARHHHRDVLYRHAGEPRRPVWIPHRQGERDAQRILRGEPEGDGVLRGGRGCEG